MNFNQLNELIPKVPSDRKNLHVHTMYISGGFGWSVRARWPGKHKDSAGDFVVETLSEGVWDDYKQFTHKDLFADIAAKDEAEPDFIRKQWIPHMLSVVSGNERPKRLAPGESSLPGIHIDALTNSIQALTVCEYRRYPQGDPRGGGRYLPVNFTLAILQDKIDIETASDKMRFGFPILRDLDFTPYKDGDDAWEYSSKNF